MNNVLGMFSGPYASRHERAGVVESKNVFHSLAMSKRKVAQMQEDGHAHEPADESP